MTVSNPEVPIEATFKWLVKENNEYRQKLDLLVPYTKKLERYALSLEEDVARLTGENNKLRHSLNSTPANCVPIKPRNFRKALGFIKQGLNLLEQGRYADCEIDDQEEMEA